jgi:hypothetical protein
MSNSEEVRIGNSIFGGKYAEDTKGNIGRGPTEAAALVALQAAQAANNNSSKK